MTLMLMRSLYGHKIMKFDPKEYIKAVLEKDPSLTSKEISNFLNSKGHNISWQVVAGIKGSLNK
jgi:hypothetical protein